MKLHLDQSAALNIFTAYGTGFVQVNATRYEHSVIVSGDSVEAWDVNDLDSPGATSYSRLVELRPEIIIIGSGARFRFPSPATLRPLIDARIGHEIMDTAAACRTYNILLTEGRNVLAALIVGN